MNMTAFSKDSYEMNDQSHYMNEQAVTNRQTSDEK
jgi:hypothetical protein